MEYAIIDNSGIVINIAVSRKLLDDNWIPFDEKPVGIGDFYDGINFYRDGERILSEKEELELALCILLGEVSA